MKQEIMARMSRSSRQQQVKKLLQADQSKSPSQIARELGIGIDYARELKKEVLSKGQA